MLKNRSKERRWNFPSPKDSTKRTNSNESTEFVARLSSHEIQLKFLLDSSSCITFSKKKIFCCRFTRCFGSVKDTKKEGRSKEPVREEGPNQDLS